MMKVFRYPIELTQRRILGRETCCITTPSGATLLSVKCVPRYVGEIQAYYLVDDSVSSLELYLQKNELLVIGTGLSIPGYLVDRVKFIDSVCTPANEVYHVFLVNDHEF